MQHFKAKGKNRDARPIVLCHGVTSTRFNWDATPEFSAPRWLSERGFDVWTVELRASGMSEKPSFWNEKEYDYSFDDYALKDATAAVDKVIAISGKDSVHWVGHSMGGMLMYAFLQRGDASKVRSATVLGSPLTLPTHGDRLRESNAEGETSAALAELYLETVKRVPNGLLAKAFAPMGYAPKLSESHYVWNTDNMDPTAARYAAAYASDDISSAVLRQFRSIGKTGQMLSADGSYDYRANMSKIQNPMLFIAGTLDHLGAPASVYAAYEAISSADKRFELLSRASGARVDYGHVDLAIGRRAADDVYPLIRDWVLEHE